MIFIKLTNGFGNNLFQYIAGRLLAQFLNEKLILILPFKDYYGLDEIDKLGLYYDDIIFKINKKKIISIGDKDYLFGFDKNLKDKNILIDGYFEDYTFFYNHLDCIKNWFTIPEKKSSEHLAFHLRTGDRLFYNFHYDDKGEPIVGLDRIEAVLNKFNFKKLSIITDLPRWEKTTIDKMKNFKLHTDLNPLFLVNLNFAVKYHNNLIEKLNKYNPIIKNNDIASDFSYMLSFDNFLFQHSTLAWWAAVISGANKVGVYGPWRPFKKEKNKNLSQIPLEGWFKWE